MKKLLAALGVVLACLILVMPAAARAQAATCNDGQPIKLADLSWESASFTTHVVSTLLEAGYGCTTQIVPGTSAAVESALVQNDLQIIAEIWSGRSEIIENAIQQGQVDIVGDTLAGGAEQGWYVPDYLVHGDPERGIEAKAPDLKSWRDLPKYSALFTDPEEPGKGRFLNCPSGWVCEKTNSRLLQLHGLEEDYTNFRAGTGAALDAAISSAYDRGQPILFYYWQPAGLMAKYKFHKIEQDPFNQQCWDTIVSGEGELCSSDFLLARLAVAVSAPFAEQNPDLVAFLKKLQFQPELLNRMILEMTETRASGEDMAARFLREHPEVWHAWLPAAAVQQVNTRLGITTTTESAGAQPAAEQVTASAGHNIFPDWSVAAFVNQQLMDVVKNYGGFFRQASSFMLTTLLLPVERLLQAVPPWAFLLLVAALSWHATRKPIATVLYVVCLYLIGAVGLWDKLIQTFALVLVSTLVSIILGVPIGIIAARSRWLRRVLTPVLDVMQTLPSFVYLIPVLMLFGLGKVPALFATIIYAVPPLIRLTILGLRQVDRDVMEAAQAFGVTRWQMLIRVTLPLARPSIMAGINQTTMMALAMVVVASMIGARGLGEDVLAGIQTLDVGRGLQAGVAIVILAIVIDRITQAYGQPRRRRRVPLQEKL
ncbi:ABC transporter permease subunit [Pusillimonas sp. MFBS29]|nr:glycine betaine ABC transporter substrate-binding protein [Pusillimonas sp. MFBS29]MCC2596023.1 ABC transporter permease subunit [Pusillimonas sp. MFBS29]